MKKIKGKDKIFEESLEVFINNGFDGTPMSLIVKKTSISNGALYHHFKSKDELIRELYINLKKSYLEKLEIGINLEGETKENLLKIWKNSIFWSMENPRGQLFINMFVNSNHRDESTEKFSQTRMELVNRIFEKGLKDDILDKNLSLNYIKSYMYGATQGVRSYLNANSSDFSEEFLDKTFESFWKSIKK